MVLIFVIREGRDQDMVFSGRLCRCNQETRFLSLSNYRVRARSSSLWIIKPAVVVIDLLLTLMVIANSPMGQWLAASSFLVFQMEPKLSMVCLIRGRRDFLGARLRLTRVVPR